MAPDLNSVPASPRPNITSNPSGTQPTSGSVSRQNSVPTSRRASHMGPPSLPLASPGGTIPPAMQSASHHGHGFPPLSPSMSGYASSVESSGVPMRHPHPMTPAEMHMELEKEQEAVVNRLTRELSALRAHSASVVSNTSSTADSTVAHAEALAGPTHPTSSRRHRSSSSVSRTGMPLAGHAQRDHRSPSFVSTPRYEEVAMHKAEMEEVKKENEMLKQRIRELERIVRGNDADAQRGRTGAPPA